MAEFRIKIAGKTAAVRSLFDSTRDYCRAYLTEEEPDFSLAVSREDLAFEQEALRQEAIEEGIRIRVFTDPFLDRAAIQRKVAENLLPGGVLLFHGSAVALDGDGYLFTADCGTGKSTHTRFWRQVFASPSQDADSFQGYGDVAVQAVLAAPGSAADQCACLCQL